jgi:hypothetical protein
LQGEPPVSPLERQMVAEVLVAAARLLYHAPLQLSDGDPPFQVHILRWLGQIEPALGNAAGGRAQLERALSIARSSGHAKVEGEILELIRDQGET